MSAFTGWENFYVIVGSSAGALIGLQFVVITLIAETPIHQDLERATDAFATPTIVHFGAVLLLAAVLSAPWHTSTPAEVVWGMLGVSGVVYTAVVLWRMRTQAAYKPEWEDWLFHVLLPVTAYATLAGSAYAARLKAGGALFGVALAALLLLFVGIHNAWDAVTYNVFLRRRKEQESKAHR